MNKKGFALLETITVSSIIIMILTVCYYPFHKILSNNDLVVEYDTIENIYKLNNVRDYIYKYIGFDNIINGWENDTFYKDKEYIYINNIEFTNTEFSKDDEDFEKLIDILDIDELFLVNYDVNDINNLNMSSDMKNYIEYIDGNLSGVNKDEITIYRLVGKFKDGTYGNIKIWKEL